MPNLTFESPARRDLARFVAYAAWGALLLYGGAFLYLAARHVLYPGFTEPMEGDALQQIERAVHGLPLYPKPDGSFVALTYLPFYYFAAAPLYQIFGDSLMGPRLLSVVSAVLAGVLVWLWARAASGERTTAHLAAAFYFGGYRVMDAYLTCALPDAFLLFWVLLGWYFLARGTRRGHDVIWLVSFTLAFWTKQQGALYFALAIVYALWLRPPAGVGETRLPRWALVLGLLLGGPLAYKFIGPLLGERFVYHTLIVPGRWAKSPFVALSRTAFVLLCFVPFGMLLAAFYALPRWPVIHPIHAPAWLYPTLPVQLGSTVLAPPLGAPKQRQLLRSTRLPLHRRCIRWSARSSFHIPPMAVGHSCGG